MRKIKLIWVFGFCFISLNIFSQITGTVTTTPSICITDGTVKISGANPASEYALTGSSIPQLGPFLPVGGMVTFTNLPKGNFTITEFKDNNDQFTQSVTVTSTYEQNWIFSASVLYDPCVAGTPEVNISDFKILGATSIQQRPPYTYRISTKGGSLNPDGTGAPAFADTSSFPIIYPGGMNGFYELQSKDACGNYKTIKVYVPQTAPAPNLNIAFGSFKNCAGDAVYNVTASNGKPDYIYKIIAGPDQVGLTKISSGGVQFDLTAGGTYTIQAMDQCGGLKTQNVNVKPYEAPTFSLVPKEGKCEPLPNGTGAFGLNISGQGIGPYSAIITNNCGEPTITLPNVPIGITPLSLLARPCTYYVTVKDGCNFVATKDVPLVPPGPDQLQVISSITCPVGASTNYVLNLNVDSLPPYNPTLPYTFHLKDNLGNYLPGYPLTMMSSVQSVALPPGDYTYQITDACGANNPLSPFKILKYEDPTVTVDVVNICFGAGQAVVMGVNKNQLSPNTYTYKISAGPTRVGQGPETDSAPNTGKFSSLQSEGIYTFSFNDGCKTVFSTVQIPKYSQPTWEVGFGALCPPNTVSNLEILNLQPEGLIVGPYRWRIIAENSDIYVTPLPFPNSTGQISPVFANLPAKDAALNTATYTIQGNDGCKNSYLGTGKVGVLPIEALILDKTSICPDGTATLRARVSIPLAGGATYVYYRNGVEVARSSLLFTFINNALPGNYTARVYPNILGNPDCFSETPTAIVVSGFIEIACVKTSYPTCANKTGGVLMATITSGTGPFTYLWNTGATTAAINGLQGGIYTVTVTDSKGCFAFCSDTLDAPINCCEIQAVVTSPIDCDNNGTFPTNDDFISFTLLPTTNVVSPTYTVTVNKGIILPSSGTYGIAKVFNLNPGSVGSGDVILTITDDISSYCTQQIIIPDPKTCDLGDLCLIDDAGLSNIVCNNNGTGGTKADDYTVFSLNPNGLGIGATYSVVIINGGGSVSPTTASFGSVTNFQFNAGSSTGGTKTIRIQDLSKQDCYFDIDVPSPGPCSNCVNPPCVPITVIKN